jgi:hypothetical protein
MKHATVLWAALGLVLALAPAPAAAADPGQQLEALALALEGIGRASDAARFREAVASIPPADLDAVYGGVDLQPLVDGLYQSEQSRTEAAAAAQETRDILGAARVRALARARSAPETIQSVGLPEAPFPTNTTDLCPDHAVPGTKSDTHTAVETLNRLNIAGKAVEQAEIILSLGRGIWDGISRACKQTVIIAGVGGNFSLACIPIDIVFAVLETVVAEVKWGYQFTQQEYDKISACDKSIETAEIAGGYNRLSHIHGDVEDFKQHINTRLDEFERKADLLLKVLLEEDLHHRSTNRLSVNYTTRLEEACDAAQEAIDESNQAGYAPATASQALHDLGRKLMPTEPKRALELCQAAYQKVTGREALRRR